MGNLVLGLILGVGGAPQPPDVFNIDSDTSSNILSSTPASYTLMFGTDTKALYLYVSGAGWSLYYQ